MSITIPSSRYSFTMPRASNRDSVLDAFAELLAKDGDRAATLDAVAEKAGVSKGGLLYHFGTKEQLVGGLVDRLEDLVDEDIVQLRAAPEGVVSEFLRVSVANDSTLDRTIVALARLAQDQRYPEAHTALQRMQERWRALVAEAVADPVVARIVMLVSDGLYFSSLLDVAAPETSREQIDEIIAALGRLDGAS